MRSLLLLSVILRCLVSMFPYSGQGNKDGRVREDGTKMYGDYEAQRHWMEITLHLPAQDWYRETRDNDLMYWGLDYPPLTAWHSKLCGMIMHMLDPPSVELYKSRGYETAASKIRMRTIVLLFDLLVFYTGMFSVARSLYKHSSSSKRVCLLLGLLSPGLILIDHGHFQFNSICLGLTAWSIAFLVSGEEKKRRSKSGSQITSDDMLGSALFCCSLCFKQIALYYSPAMFFYLLGRCLQSKRLHTIAFDIAKLGATVIVTFAICFFPWVLSVESTLQVIHRIFPIKRGLFEDKVANFWCASAPLLRWKTRFSSNQLVTLSMFATILGFIPAAIVLLRSPTSKNFLMGLLTSSLAFFLFAYQVHEKSILFPLLPLHLLAMSDQVLALLTPLFTHFAIVGMFPLLLRDGLLQPYLVMLALSWMLIFYIHNQVQPLQMSRLMKTCAIVVYAGSIGVTLVLHALEFSIKPPQRYPDLHVLLLMIMCAGVNIVSLVTIQISMLFHRTKTAEALKQS